MRGQFAEVVMTIGFRERRMSDDWSGVERRRDCSLPEVSSQPTPGPCWEQLPADLVEVGQGEHGLRPRQVFGQAAVSHFGETPQLLDHAKGVFAASRVRERARLIIRQRSGAVTISGKGDVEMGGRRT